ncbi:MAG: AsmA-like C-terminal region-containing protein [Pseudomonadota bacterium]
MRLPIRFVIAVLLLGLSLIAITLRFALPEISEQRTNIESWVAEVIGRPLDLGEISATWDGWTPRVHIDGLTFQDPTRQQDLVRFERAQIEISPLASLLRAELIPKRVVLSGVRLTLIRHEDGRFSVAGMPPPKSPIIKWIIEQDHFAVNGADFEIIDRAEDRRFHLEDLSVAVRNDGPLKLISSYVVLPEHIGGAARIDLRSQGDPLTDAWSGSINFRVVGLKTSFLDDSGRLDSLIQTPAIDLTAWTHWENAKLQQTLFAAENKSRGFKTNGALQRRAGGWRLGLADLDLPDGKRTVGRVSLAWSQAHTGEREIFARAAQFDISSLAAALQANADDAALLRTLLADGLPDGRLEHLSMAWISDGKAPPSYFADAEVRDLELPDSARYPGAVGLDLNIVVRTGHTALKIDSAQVRLFSKRWLAESISLADLEAELEVAFNASGAVLSLPMLETKFEGIPLSSRVHLKLPNGERPMVEARIELGAGDATALHRLLPKAILPAKGENWMRGLFQSGRLNGGFAVLRGPLEAFPFHHGEGVFKGRFDFANANVEYSKRWPAGSGFDFTVGTNGPQVTATISRGHVAGADIQNAELLLPNTYIKKRMLHMEGSATGTVKAAKYIVANSPLKKGKAGKLEKLTLAGPLDMMLDLNIALYKGGPKEILGQAHLKGTTYTGYGTEIRDITGAVSFTREDWYGEQLSGSFEGTPVSLIVQGGLDDPNYQSEFHLTGTSSGEQVLGYLQRWAPTFHRWLGHAQALQTVKGSMPWRATLSLPEKNETNDPPRRLRIESSLQGLAFDLSEPFSKTAAMPRALSVEVISDSAGTISTNVQYADLVTAHLTMDDEHRVDGKRRKVAQADYQLGAPLAEPVANEPGVNIQGHLPELDFPEWNQRFFGHGRAHSRPTHVNLQFDVIRFMGREFNSNRVQAAASDGGWRINIEGQDVAGQIMVPTGPIADATLALQLERLRVPNALPQAQRELVDPRRLPALDFACEALVFRDIDFGTTQIETVKTATGLELKQLVSDNNGFNAIATGRWDVIEDQHVSAMDVEIESDSLANLLGSFSYDVAALDGGQTHIDIGAEWLGMPSDFKLNKLNGQLDLNVAAGKLLDIEPGSGRLFGLLSVQSLPRRLSLDFDDLFNKGFAFDTIEGKFLLEDGNAYTDSLVVAGPAARVDVSGRTGLAQQDYDQHVVVTPALSDSFPVASALFGPVGVGVGAAVYLGQKVFKSIPEQVDRVLSKEYTVTGSWEDPVIEKI